MHNENIHDHILWTYICLRAGMAAIAFLFPLFLWWGGYAFQQELMSSMSAYYYSPMRNLFVGALCAIGAFLFLYRGFSQQENWALNGAGLLALGIAWFPTKRPQSVVELCGPDSLLAVCQINPLPWWHVTCVLGFFACLVYVSRWRSVDTLGELRADTNAVFYHRREFYETWYKRLSNAMIVFPISAILILLLTERWQYVAFGVELAAIWVFSAYWLLKTIEIQSSEWDDTVMRAGHKTSTLHIESHAMNPALTCEHCGASVTETVVPG